MRDEAKNKDKDMERRQAIKSRLLRQHRYDSYRRTVETWRLRALVLKESCDVRERAQHTSSVALAALALWARMRRLLMSQERMRREVRSGRKGEGRKGKSLRGWGGEKGSRGEGRRPERLVGRPRDLANRNGVMPSQIRTEHIYELGHGGVPRVTHAAVPDAWSRVIKSTSRP